MIVRFGYVAMSMGVKNSSPSKTMTATSFKKIGDKEAAIRKLERLAADNLHNTLRLLRHNRAYDIKLYRCSSRLIPLLGHEMLEDWQPIPTLAEQFKQVGDYAKEHGMRLSFHPDHFTVLSTPRPDVYQKSVADLVRHVQMLDAMGLDEQSKCNIHIGGTYGSKETAMARFLQQFREIDETIQRHITLENDDKTFTAIETLEACEILGVPMVLDIHHHAANHNGEAAAEIWPRIMKTWELSAPPITDPATKVHTGMPPKIHVSSPKNEKDPRGHSDYVNPTDLLNFLRSVADVTPRLDVMIEAKMKDAALLQLMKDFENMENIKIVNQASIEL